MHASKGRKSHLVYGQHGSEHPSKPSHEPTRSSERSYCSTFRTVPERLPKTLPGNGQERRVGDPIYPSAPTSGFQRSCHAHIPMLASSWPPRSVMATRSANPSVHLPLHRCVYFCEQREFRDGILQLARAYALEPDKADYHIRLLLSSLLRDVFGHR